MKFLSLSNCGWEENHKVIERSVINSVMAGLNNISRTADLLYNDVEREIPVAQRVESKYS